MKNRTLNMLGAFFVCAVMLLSPQARAQEDAVNDTSQAVTEAAAAVAGTVSAAEVAEATAAAAETTAGTGAEANVSQAMDQFCGTCGNGVYPFAEVGRQSMQALLIVAFVLSLVLGGGHLWRLSRNQSMRGVTT